MGVTRMHHVGVVVGDLDSAIEFFAGLGFDVGDEAVIEDEVVDRIIGLEGVRSRVAMVEVPDGKGRLELIQFDSPPAQDGDAGAPANALGLRHVTFEVDDLDAAVEGALAKGGDLVGEVARYGGTYRLCYIRGPEGIIVELAERLS